MTIKLEIKGLEFDKAKDYQDKQSNAFKIRFKNVSGNEKDRATDFYNAIDAKIEDWMPMNEFYSMLYKHFETTKAGFGLFKNQGVVQNSVEIKYGNNIVETLKQTSNDIKSTRFSVVLGFSDGNYIAKDGITVNDNM